MVSKDKKGLKLVEPRERGKKSSSFWKTENVQILQTSEKS